MGKLKKFTKLKAPSPDESYVERAKNLPKSAMFPFVALSLKHYKNNQCFLGTDNGYVLKEWQWNEIKESVNNFFDNIDSKEIDKANKENRLRKIEKRRESNKGKQDKVTRRDIGYVYLMKGSQYYKIGKSTAPVKRYENLAVKLPFEVEMIHKVKSNQYSKLEKFLHDKFSDKRTNGEWFDLDKGDVEYIKNLNGDEYQ